MWIARGLEMLMRLKGCWRDGEVGVDIVPFISIEKRFVLRLVPLRVNRSACSRTGLDAGPLKHVASTLKSVRIR